MATIYVESIIDAEVKKAIVENFGQKGPVRDLLVGCVAAGLKNQVVQEQQNRDNQKYFEESRLAEMRDELQSLRMLLSYQEEVSKKEAARQEEIQTQAKSEDFNTVETENRENVDQRIEAMHQEQQEFNRLIDSILQLDTQIDALQKQINEEVAAWKAEKWTPGVQKNADDVIAALDLHKRFSDQLQLEEHQLPGFNKAVDDAVNGIRNSLAEREVPGSMAACAINTDVMVALHMRDLFSFLKKEYGYKPENSSLSLALGFGKEPDVRAALNGYHKNLDGLRAGCPDHSHTLAQLEDQRKVLKEQLGKVVDLTKQPPAPAPVPAPVNEETPDLTAPANRKGLRPR